MKLVQLLSIGMFPLDTDAEYAIYDLKQLGIKPDTISVLMKIDREFGMTTRSALGGLNGIIMNIKQFTLPQEGSYLIGGPLADFVSSQNFHLKKFDDLFHALGMDADTAFSYESRIQEGGILMALNSKESQLEEIHTIFEENYAYQMQSIPIREDFMISKLFTA